MNAEEAEYILVLSLHLDHVRWANTARTHAQRGLPVASYSRERKAAVVADAQRTSVAQAARATGIPDSTIRYWFDDPDFANIRERTKEETARSSLALAALAQGELARRIRAGKISDQSLVATYGVSIDKFQLLSGEATSRSENRDLTGRLDDHEKDALRRALDSFVAGEPVGDRAEGDPG